MSTIRVGKKRKWRSKKKRVKKNTVLHTVDYFSRSNEHKTRQVPESSPTETEDILQ